MSYNYIITRIYTYLYIRYVHFIMLIIVMRIYILRQGDISSIGWYKHSYNKCKY